jgi:hypothetical protein
MLSAGTLLAAHVSNLRNLNLGFQRDSVLLVALDPSRSGYERLQLSSLYRDLLARLDAIPGVRASTLSGMTPISAQAAALINVDGVNGRQRIGAVCRWRNRAAMFQTYGTPLIASPLFVRRRGPRTGGD